MQLISLPLAGSVGRFVLINPEQVVCIVDLGEKRSQVVTTGLSDAASMSLLVELSSAETARRLTALDEAAPLAQATVRRRASLPPDLGPEHAVI